MSKSTVHDLIQRWQEQRQRGRLVSPEELCEQSPELLPELRTELKRLEDSTETLPPPIHDAGTVTPSADTPDRSPDHPVEEFPQISGYRIDRELGRGGMGVVYLATDLSLGRQVAIKVGTTQSTKANRARFQAEAAALARLHHPHFVQIFGSGTTAKGLNYFIMEYVTKGSLAECTGKQAQSPADAVRLLQLLARAIHFAHQRGIIHRDLKPANILMAVPSDEPSLNCSWGMPKIADFGLVKVIDETSPEHQATTTGQVLGTPSYMAPEQARSGKTIGPATDVYALGAILYMLLTGRPPFQGGTSIDVILQMLEEDPPSLLELRPDLPRGLVAICEKCLAKKPEDRFANAGKLLEAVEEFQRTGEVAHLQVKTKDKTEEEHEEHDDFDNPIVSSLSLVLDTTRAWVGLLIPIVAQSGDFAGWSRHTRIIVRVLSYALLVWALWWLGVHYFDMHEYLPSLTQSQAAFYLPVLFLLFVALCWFMFWLIVKLFRKKRKRKLDTQGPK